MSSLSQGDGIVVQSRKDRFISIEIPSFFRYLLLVYEYDMEVFRGPPRAVFKKEVEKLFGEK